MNKEESNTTTKFFGKDGVFEIVKGLTGVFNNQDKEFVKKFSKTVPLGRMIEPEELISHVAYLTSSDSKFLTGQNILVDGGRSIW